MVAITSLAAMSIWSVVISSLCVSCWSVSNVSLWAVRVVSLPSW